MTARGLRGSGRAFVLAGLLTGLATLARNDGLLVLAVLILAVAWDRLRAWRSSGPRAPAISGVAALGAVVLFLAVMGPWWARQLAVFGSLSPSTASGKVLFIRDIGEWNSITTPATLDHLLGMGPGALLATRLGGLIAAVMIFVTLICGFILALPLAIGAWAQRRSVDFGPFFAYGLILVAFSSLVSAVHVPGGTFIHSAVALAPHSYILALEGIAVGVAWVAARRRALNADEATRIFTAAAVAFGLGAALLGALTVHDTWSLRRADAGAVAAALEAAGALTTDRVMSIDASGTRYATGHGGVVLVNDPLDTIQAVADAYDIRWLVLDRADGVASVAPILDGTVRPPWLGEPILTRGSPTDLVVYPVLEAGQ